MISTIKGIEYIDGTSKNSLYPVVAWHKNGVKIGARFEVAKAKHPEGVYSIAIYGRIQMFDEFGNDKVLDYKSVADALPNLEIRLSSPKHLSGFLAKGLVQQKEGNDNLAERTEAFGQVYARLLGKFANSFNLESLSQEVLVDIGKERFLTQTSTSGAVADEASVEKKLDDSFDFKTMLDKPKPSN